MFSNVVSLLKGTHVKNGMVVRFTSTYLVQCLWPLRFFSEGNLELSFNALWKFQQSLLSNYLLVLDKNNFELFLQICPAIIAILDFQSI
jgi:hypothetical protein